MNETMYWGQKIEGKPILLILLLFNIGFRVKVTGTRHSELGSVLTGFQTPVVKVT